MVVLARGTHDPGLDGPVFALQSGLRELGFAVVGNPDGDFGPHTEWAVREFQIAARWNTVARQAVSADCYADTLEPVENPVRLTSTVTGVADDELVDLVQRWTRESLRCPVVLEAWDVHKGAPTTVVHQNVWAAEDVVSHAPRVYARDLSERWPIPSERTVRGRVVVGDLGSIGRYAGPRSVPPRHTWPEAEVTPELLTGREWGELEDDEQSTFRVVRAISERECLGFLDAINCYDNAIVSLGPCHWTLSLPHAGRPGDGELPPVLAWFQNQHPGYTESFGGFGLFPEEAWPSDRAGVPIVQPRSLWKEGQRKYGTGVSWPTPSGAETITRLGDLDWFRSWHWAYRFVMAGRTQPAWARTAWDMARLRLQDLAATPLSEALCRVLSAPLSTRLGDVATSEAAIAVLLRWHIRAPGEVITDGHTGRVLAAAIGDRFPALADWADVEEARLVESILDAARRIRGDENFVAGLRSLAEWPDWSRSRNPRGYRLDPGLVGGLRHQRKTFRLAEVRAAD